MQIKIGSGTMIVLSSPTAIKEVIDKQGWVASSRPANYLAGLAGGGYHVLFAPDSMYSIAQVAFEFSSSQLPDCEISERQWLDSFLRKMP